MTTHDKAHEDRVDPLDPVAQYLATRGVSDEIRARGLRGIVAQWEAIAASAARYDLTLEDWLNDLDLRDIIAGAVTAAPEHERRAILDLLARADELFRTATVETKQSLWGDAVASADKHCARQQWWYFRHPAHPGETMRADLTAAGIP